MKTQNESQDIVENNNRTGNFNSGYCNSGDFNSGDYNSGYCNSGNRNSGNRNSGNSNSGNYNSGYCNSGDYNSGDCNSGNRNSGHFNTEEPNAIMFNKDTGKKISEIAMPFINIKLTEWIAYSQEEKNNDPNKNLIGGYLKTYTYYEAWANWDNNATDDMRNEIKNLPNFDPNIFMQITGLDWRNK